MLSMAEGWPVEKDLKHQPAAKVVAVRSASALRGRQGSITVRPVVDVIVWPLTP